MVYHIIKIVTTTGEIISITDPGGSEWPEEGPIEGEDNVSIVHELQPIQGPWHVFMEQYFYPNGEKVYRGTKPNEFYDWSSVSQEWEFNSTNFWGAVRVERNRKLSACDWTQITDNSLHESVKADWRNYRNLLRDLPERPTDATTLDQIDWPAVPDGTVSEVTPLS